MILVTGGAGFIGSNIVAGLKDAVNPIVVCDWFGTDDKWKNLRYAAVDTFVLPDQLDQWLHINGDQLTAIVHMGAISATTERDVDLIVRSNIQLSRTLWNLAAKNRIPFIYASSAATYGGGEHGFEDRTDREYLDSLRPLNPYGWSKHIFDRQVLSLVERGEASPPRWAGLKFFNVYGPRESHKGSMRSVVDSNFASLRAGGTLRLFKSEHPDYVDGGQKRDFVFVQDCVKVISWMLGNNFTSGIYNVGSGVARPWVDVAHAMFAALGQEPRIEFIEMPEHLKGRYQYFTEATMTKLKSAGFALNTTSLEDGIVECYRYLEQEVNTI